MNPQLEFVKQLLAKDNVVFALARNPDNSVGLQAIKDNKNLHLIKGDITKPEDMKVSVRPQSSSIDRAHR